MIFHSPRLIFFLSLALLILGFEPLSTYANEQRKELVRAVLSQDGNEQTEIIKKLVDTDDAFVHQALAAWRQGELFLFAATDGSKVPLLLDAEKNSEGKARGIKIVDGQPVTDANGAEIQFLARELTPADTTSKLRKAIKTTLDLLSLGNPNPNMRRDAITKLGQDQNLEYLPFFQSRLQKETEPRVRTALEESIALTQLVEENQETRVAAIQKLALLRSIGALSFIKQAESDATANPSEANAAVRDAARRAAVQIEDYIFWGNMAGTAFRGISLSSVLLVVALGLAITFGLMGIINMAHGEVMMVGAYSAFVTQNIFKSWFGLNTFGFECYFVVSLGVAFVTASIVGIILERSVIRFLYSRPLESLLATWGVSLVMQQIFRTTFGAANVQVSSPQWLSGSFSVYDVLFAYNRLFVIGFAVFVVLLTYFLLTRTPLGLQIRAVMQNRNMAACIGVRTDRVNMMTFAFGSGLAGMAGACLSQIGNVGPSLGQNYIVDCFMIVVLGGVGNLVGTVSASLGVGVVDQMLQPVLGAVMGKICVLAAIILFLQWRPSGLFVTRTRNLEG